MSENCVTTKILGYIKANALLLMILVTTTGLFTSSLVKPQRENISEESISGRNESLELLLLLRDEELHLKVTGNNTTEVVQSLKRMLQNMDGTLLVER
jgi:hypothetical protein